MQLTRVLVKGAPGRRRAWISGDEIVTGERLQGLAGISLVPAHVAEFHRGVERHVHDLLSFERYRDLGASELERLSAQPSLFVYTHELPGFLEAVWPRLEGEGYVLLTHNSDDEIGESHLAWLDASGAKLAHWFAQNATVRHPKLTPLPIGVANRMWEHGNTGVLERVIRRRAGKPKRRLLAATFDPGTHPSRPQVAETLRLSFPDLVIASPRISSYRRYLEHLAEHRFCACPRGNGIDSHRVWECLYLDVIPILERSPHSEQWSERGLPVVLVEDWAEVTPPFLDARAPLPSGGFSAQAREPLRMSYYAQMVARSEGAESEADSPGGRC